MPILVPLFALGVATLGFVGGGYVSQKVVETSEDVEQVGNRALAAGAGLTAASAAALVLGGPWVAILALGAGVAGVSTTVAGAKVKWGDPEEAAKAAAMIAQS